MTACSRGDVILVEIAFSGAPGSKRRPAVILSSEEFNTAGIKVVVGAVTGNLTPPLRPGDTLLRDWQEAGLIKPSAIRGILATVDKSDVVRKLGRLSDADFTSVMNGVAQVLELAPIPIESNE